MNREQTIEAIRVMDAFINGMEVECWTHGYDGWETANNPSWDWLNCTFRIKPAATLRPWTADEVPLGAWMRFKRNPQDRVLLGWVSVQADRDLWLDEREYSTDGGKTWLPCGVVEETK